MANLHLVTGFAGYEHITSADHGSFNVAMFGNSQGVLDRGSKFAAQIVSNNQITVSDGDIIMQGRHIRLNEGTTVDLTIENGTQGYFRNDLIVVRYTRDAVTAVEECNLVVLKGEPVASNPSDPAYTVGDLITEHALVNDIPLYRVPLDGLNVGELVPLFGEIGTLTDELSALNKTINAVAKTAEAAQTTAAGKADASHNHSASNITSGTMAVARGGTGKTSFTANRLIYPSASTTLNQLAFPTVAGSVLRQGTSGAPYWTSLADLATAMGGAKVATGSYVGTGTYGASNPNSLTFGFAPKLLVINVDYKNQHGETALIVRPDAYSAYAHIANVIGNTSNNLVGRVEGTTVYWYSTSDTGDQMNQKYTYYYLAIG